MAGLLALVANTLLRGLRGAVTAKVTDLTAVVAFLTLGAVAAGREMGQWMTRKQ